MQNSNPTMCLLEFLRFAFIYPILLVLKHLGSGVNCSKKFTYGDSSRSQSTLQWPHSDQMWSWCLKQAYKQLFLGFPEDLWEEESKYKELAGKCKARGCKTGCNSHGHSLVRALKMEWAGQSGDHKCYLDTSRGLITPGSINLGKLSGELPEVAHEPRRQNWCICM